MATVTENDLEGYGINIEHWVSAETIRSVDKDQQEALKRFFSENPTASVNAVVQMLKSTTHTIKRLKDTSTITEQVETSQQGVVSDEEIMIRILRKDHPEVFKLVVAELIEQKTENLKKQIEAETLKRLGELEKRHESKPNKS